MERVVQVRRAEPADAEFGEVGEIGRGTVVGERGFAMIEKWGGVRWLKVVVGQGAAVTLEETD